jgi:hypothetical protein
MNRRSAELALAAADIPQADSESQLFTIERVLGKLGTSFEQHVDLLRNSVSLEVRVDYLAAVFGHDAARAAHVLFDAVVHQPRPVPPAQRDEDGDRVTYPLPSTAQRALEDFDARHLYERDVVLAPYGLSSYHLTAVEYRGVGVDASGDGP